MWRLTCLVLAMGLFFLGFAFPASAQAPCAPRATVIDTLSKQYKEAPRGIGMVTPTSVMEIFVSAKGSWTILVTDTRGISCVLAAGQEWELIPLPVGEVSS